MEASEKEKEKLDSIIQVQGAEIKEKQQLMEAMLQAA